MNLRPASSHVPFVHSAPGTSLVAEDIRIKNENERTKEHRIHTK